VNKSLIKTYPAWRICVIDLVAKALGVLVHIEAYPFGFARIYRRSPAGSVNTGHGSARALPVYDPLTGTARFPAEVSAVSADASRGEPERPEVVRQ
jgi:hypothetical protein